MKNRKSVLLLLVILLNLIIVGCGSEYSINVTTEGQGTVVKEPLQAKYKLGAVVDLTAQPATGWRFDHWEGSGYQGKTTPSIEVEIAGNLSLTAVFKEVPEEQQDKEYTSQSYTQVSKNTSILTADGFYIGEGTQDVSVLRKEITVSLITPNDSFQIGTAFALRRTDKVESVYLVIPVKNVSETTYGFIKATGIVYKDSNGGMLDQDELGSYIEGSVGKSSVITTQTCLFPGETGYILDITTKDIFSLLDTVVLTSIESRTGYVETDSSLVPNGITYNASKYSDSMTVSVINTGTHAAFVDNLSIHSYILLDEDSLPLFFGYLNLATPVNGLIDVDATGTLEETYLNYSGKAGKLLVLTNFEDYQPIEGNSSMRTLDKTMNPEDILKERNRRIEEQYVKYYSSDVEK